MAEQRTYIAIDLKSFYASVECIERNLDPMHTNLVVADAERTEKTICLAVSPTLRACGVPGRARLFEVVQKVKELNRKRICRAPGKWFSGRSWDDTELEEDPSLELTYITARPQMARYVERSTEIYRIYLRFAAPEDIHVYSIDEVFIDVTDYLKTCGMTARQLAGRMMRTVLDETGITATAGIGSNLYLCKVALDIKAKHAVPDQDGMRIAELSEESYRKFLWGHRPLTDFWRVGKGYAGKLEANGLFTMGDIARCSLGKSSDFYNEDLLYRLFGINAELLIDHAWGWEPCTLKEIRSYRPQFHSIGAGQVLQKPYPYEKARIVVREMTEGLVLELVEKGLVTSQVELTIGYDIENLRDPVRRKQYHGAVTTDHYGRQIPRHAHGTEHLQEACSSTRLIMEAMMRLFARVADPSLLIRRITVTADRVLQEEQLPVKAHFEQLELFRDYEKEEQERQEEKQLLDREKRLQHAMLDIKRKFGKNAVLKGTNLQEGATAKERNRQIGGHRA